LYNGISKSQWCDIGIFATHLPPICHPSATHNQDILVHFWGILDILKRKGKAVQPAIQRYLHGFLSGAGDGTRTCDLRITKDTWK
jgi:hypothetical protein